MMYNLSSNVNLIVMLKPTSIVQAGRAEQETRVLLLCFLIQRRNVSRIERESGVKFEHVSAPQPVDIAQSAGVEAAASILQIADSVIPAFKKSAEELLSTSGLSAADLLAKALAKAAGYTEIKERSLTGMEGYVTLILEAGRPISTPSVAYGVLRRFLPEENVETVQGFAITVDQKGAVFDVPLKDLDTFLVGAENAANVSIDVVKTLPSLQEKEPMSRRFGNSRGGGGFSCGGGGSRFGGRGGRSNGFSDRRNSGSSRFGGGGRNQGW